MLLFCQIVTNSPVGFGRIRPIVDGEQRCSSSRTTAPTEETWKGLMRLTLGRRFKLEMIDNYQSILIELGSKIKGVWLAGDCARVQANLVLLCLQKDMPLRKESFPFDGVQPIAFGKRLRILNLLNKITVKKSALPPESVSPKQVNKSLSSIIWLVNR